jgi:hypothetical protein
MSTPLEERVERLERIVDKLQSGHPQEPGQDDWQVTIGAFSKDKVAQEIIAEALQLREEERRQIAP